MKILVRAPNWVGDAVMAIPALRAIRCARPEAEIFVLARTAVADTYQGQPFADKIMEYDNRGHHGFAGRERLITEIRREKFDAALLLQNAFEAAWLAWRANIPERIGYAREGRGLLLTKSIRVPHAGEILPHESQYYLELLRRAQWIKPGEEIQPVRLLVADAERKRAEACLLAAGVRNGSWRCAIAPGASYGAAKCWPAERFAAVADRLVSECGADVILFGTPGEKEIAARICSAMRSRSVSLVGQTAMRDLAPLFSACSVFVGNDSGAMHVAAAVGLPVIGIFGSTDPAGTAPLTSQFTLIRERVPCSPCFLRTCPVDHRCMTRIEVDSVLAAAQRLQFANRASHSWSNPNA